MASTLMAAIEGAGYGRLRGRGTGRAECLYEKGSGGVALGLVVREVSRR
jgi:hypothetical protein